MPEPLTDEELAAQLRADPGTQRLADELGLTVDEYIAETLKYLANPERGFMGGEVATDAKPPIVLPKHVRTLKG